MHLRQGPPIAQYESCYVCCLRIGNNLCNERCPAPTNVTTSGKKRAIAPTIPTFMNPITSTTWEASDSRTFSTSKPLKSRDGTIFCSNIRNMAQKTSLSFISCYASKITDYVYMQRGFRNYGKPQVLFLFYESNNSFLDSRKSNLVWITQLTLKDCVSAHVRLVRIEKSTLSETASMNVTRVSQNKLIRTLWGKSSMNNVNVLVPSAPLESLLIPTENSIVWLTATSPNFTT